MATYEITCETFVREFFATKNDYSKYDSPENRPRIVERVVSFEIPHSGTAVRRAILELVAEGQIGRADGKTDEDDRREAEQAAEEQDRRTALVAPLTRDDANYFGSLSLAEVSRRYFSDRVFRFRYEAASRLWGFRLPAQPNTPPPQEEQEVAPEILNKIKQFESGQISTYQFRLACKNDRVLRDAYERHIGLAALAAGSTGHQ